ncbi:winged helix DNA-binding domain-containing protein [Nocardia sp. NBC_00508]|uniref:DNA glycosylase AlkZ-like family protein n=1 Tax=Nocardia sp. NBC_00508 TaxID=2975992 RepID=UPI002E7FDC73|nr:crosslink repair DNA glycosylase YcaQ family protein [Nocardia sp. NBC_00508]WUD66494.1 winged helix DNA-binding domain-containing protein [Nocardia sp. NBC_00508]
MRVTWDQVFAWRLSRQYVASRADEGAVEIAERLCGVQAQVTSAAELAVALRGTKPEPGALVRALDDGVLMKTWAMRGTLHALTPALAAACLALIGSARTWEKPSWQKHFGASPAEVAALTEAVAEVLDSAVLTRDELVEALVSDPGFHRLGAELRSGWGALLKPLAWQGALCHGPARGSKVTFAGPAHLVRDWPGLPEPDAAAPLAILGYLNAYGPATPETFDAWLSRNSLRKTTVRRWFADLGDRLTEVDVEGRSAFLPTDQVDPLAATAPNTSVHLLGAFDQYVLGPGTGDTALLPGAHRAKVSRTAGWISPIVVVSGRIVGTWELADDAVEIAMFDGAHLPKQGLDAAVAHVAVAVGRETLTVRPV